MRRLNIIDDSVEVTVRKLATHLRDRILAQVYEHFAGRKVTQRELAKLFGISQAYVAGVIKRAAEHQEQQTPNSAPATLDRQA
jgi:DNA-binding GntR family transcriptional regulator